MCKYFEMVSGKKCEGDVNELKSIARQHHGDKFVIADVRVEMFQIDEGYQTQERTKRSLRKLANNWDDFKCLPVIGVPHWEDGTVYLVDGYGRWIASQMINDKKETLMCMLVLDAPNDPVERRKFEAEHYAYQNREVANMKPIQRHGALTILDDNAALLLNEMQKEYGFAISKTSGQRDKGVIGSYTDAYSICKNGKDCANFVFGICEDSGMNLKTNGYSRYVIRPIRDMYKLYGNDHEVANIISDYLRDITPSILRTRACNKYELLTPTMACSMFIEDLIVEKGYKHKRAVINKTVFFINPSEYANKAGLVTK